LPSSCAKHTEAYRLGTNTVFWT